MRTLSRQCFDKQWIEQTSRRLQIGNTFFEKSLYAFELLGRLAQEGLAFVFKGGTSLLLRLPNPRRLSIDLDVVSREFPDRLERILKRCATVPFTGYEEDQRRHNRPPRRRHWNFRYNSVNPEGCPEPYVILDVLEEENLYIDVEPCLIATPLFTTDHKVRVRVPTVDNLLADKLAAFAPDTIGQEYNADRPEKIIKHLFDIGELFAVAQSVATVRNVYRTIAAAEIEYRKPEKHLTLSACLADTISTARLVTGLAVNQEFDPLRCAMLRSGVSLLSSHLMASDFTVRDAAVAAGKAALLAALVQTGVGSPSLDTFRHDASKADMLADVRLQRFPELAKLPGASPEAFHYWHLVDRLMR